MQNNKIDYNHKVLEVKDLKRQFRISRQKGGKVYAIDGISFDVYKREVFGLVGESGCGKTTTGRTIIKLYEPTDGTIKFNGYPIAQGHYENTKIIRRARAATRKKIREANPLKNAILIKEKQLEENITELDLEIKILKDKYENDLAELNRPKIEILAKIAEIKRERDNELSLTEFSIKNEIKDIKLNEIKKINYEANNTISFAKKRMEKKISSIKISPISKEEKLTQIDMAKQQYINDVNLANAQREEQTKNAANKIISKEEQQAKILELKQSLVTKLAEINERYNAELLVEEQKLNALPDLKEEKTNLKEQLKADINKIKEQKRELKLKHKEEIKAIKADAKANPDKYQTDKEAIQKAKEEFLEVVKEQREFIQESKRITAMKEKPEVIKERKQRIEKVKLEANEKIQNLKQQITKDLTLEEKKRINEQIQQINNEKRAEIAKIKDEKITYKKVVKSMQMIFQDPISSLNPRMTVHDIIAEGLIIQGIEDKEYIERKVKESLELVGLTESHSSRYIHEFSGGQRQRIGIARALVVEPEFIIADEPISALDVSIQAQVINLLTDLKEKLGLTILFIAHDLSVVKYFSDRIAVMYRGKIVELTTSEELFANPLHPYTKSLLSAIPHPDPISEAKRVRVEYDPSIHNYKKDKPEMHEIKPGHFIYANQEELAKYREELKNKGVVL